MGPAPNSVRSKKKRDRQRAAVPAEFLTVKNQVEKQKKQSNQLARRLQDKSYDDKILQLNRDRVKRFRDKKRGQNKENVPPQSENVPQPPQLPPIKLSNLLPLRSVKLSVLPPVILTVQVLEIL